MPVFFITFMQNTGPMRLFVTLTLMLLAMGLNAQLNYPWNPDENGDSSIGTTDLVGFLSVYGENFVPEPVPLDSVDLLTVVLSLQSQLEVLQAQVDSLTMIAPTTEGLLVIHENDTISSNTQSLQFTGPGVSVSNGDALEEAVVHITGGSGGGGSKVYAFKVNYGGSSASGEGGRFPGDVSTVTQIVSDPFQTGSTMITIPSSTNDNKIRFRFNSEYLPPANIFILGYSVTNNKYRWTQIDASERALFNQDISVITGLTQNTTPAANGSYTDTNILTDYSSAEFQIRMDGWELGVASDGLFQKWAHAYLFFIFPS